MLCICAEPSLDHSPCIRAAQHRQGARPWHPRVGRSPMRQGAEFLWGLGGGPIDSTGLSARACRWKALRAPGLRSTEASAAGHARMDQSHLGYMIHISMDKGSGRAISEWTKAPSELFENARGFRPRHSRMREGSVRDIRERARVPASYLRFASRYLS